MQRDDVGLRQEVVERHGAGAELLRAEAIAGGRIVVADRAAHAMERLRHRAADGAETDHADQEAIEAGEIVGQHAGAECGVAALLDLGIGPGEAAQQGRRGCDGVFRDRGVAAAGDVGNRDAEPRHRRLVEPVDAGAGDLDEADRRVLEQRRRQLRPDRRDHHRARRLDQARELRIVGRAVAHRQFGRRQAHRRA